MTSIPQTKRQRIQRLRKAGYNLTEIASLVEVSWRTAARWAKRVDAKEAAKAARHPEEVMLKLGVPPRFLASLVSQMRMATCPKCETDFVVLATVASVTCSSCGHSYWRAVEPASAETCA